MNRSLARRQFLRSTAATPLLAASTSLAADESQDPRPTWPKNAVDTNVHLFQWPFRRLPLDTTQKLVDKLRRLKITKALAASFSGVLQRDVAGVNQQLVAACQPFSELVPVGTLNLSLPNWQRDFEQCQREFKVAAVRLYPNYHQYSLAGTSFRRLLSLAERHALPIQICVALEDDRTQHRLVRAAPTDLAPLPKVLADFPKAQVQLLNCTLSLTKTAGLAECPQLSFDTARIDGTDGIEQLLQRIPIDRVMFGTHAPFLIPEASTIRLLENDLSSHARQKILSNANQWVPAR